MEVWITITSILVFVLFSFLWVNDTDNKLEKYIVPIIVVSGVFSLLSLMVIGPPSLFSEIEIMILIVLFFTIVFLFLTLAEEEQLRVILFGSAIAVIISIVFLQRFLELGMLPWSEEYILELEHEPALFFEIALFFEYINWEVISIVFGMSLLVAVLTSTGLFDMVAIRTIKTSQGTPKIFLILVFFLTLILSALLDNTTAIILLSGITITVTRSLNLNPKPYILAEVIATIMAGIITVIGSLPGILIAGEGDIPFITFSLINSGYIVVSIIISLAYTFLIFKEELKPSEYGGIDPSALEWLDEWSVVDSKRKLYLGTAVLSIVVIGLVLSSSIGLSVGFVAVTGAIIAIVVTETKIERVIHEIEMDSILFFIGLFVLVGTLRISGALKVLADVMRDISGGEPLILAILIVSIVSILSAVVANIPVTIAMAEVINILVQDEQFISNTIFGHPIVGFLWFTLLYAVTFGGGLTPFGTVTGVIGTQVLSNEGYTVGFMEYVKKIVPLCVVLLILGFIYLLFMQATGLLTLLFNL